MKYLNPYFLIVAICALISCSEEQVTNSSPLECDKLTSSEDAQNLMTQANDDRFSDSTMIVENLIGEWGLIGIMPGWVGFEIGQECIRLTIDSDMIKLEDLNSNNNSSTEWELRKIEVNGYIGFYLETNEDVWKSRIGMQIFSENIMYGSGNVDDADIYIYEKLE